MSKNVDFSKNVMNNIQYKDFNIIHRFLKNRIMSKKLKKSINNKNHFLFNNLFRKNT